MDFWGGIAVGCIGSLLATLIVYLLTKKSKKYKPLWELMKTGLKSFLPLDEFIKYELFEKMIDNGKVDDEVVIVGRTNRWLIEKKKRDLEKGLKNGLKFKVLLLNPYKIGNGTIELRSLQLKNPKIINNDLEISLNEIENICNNALQQKYKGSFDVRMCDYVVFNSFISFTQEKMRRIVLDFSFSEDNKDKYQQYYECNPQDKSEFVNKLYDFYKGIYDQNDSYIYYDGKRIWHREDLIKEDINNLIQEYSEHEKIRRNNVKNFLFLTPNLFRFIEDNRSPIYPHSIQLELTNKCNTKCMHCKRYTWPNSEEMSTERINNLLDELGRLRVQSITLSGGEPTLREDFIDILRYAYIKGLKVGVLSNGLNIKPELADALAKYSNWVRISLDASSAETYQRVRGDRDDFEKVLVSLKNLGEANRRNSKLCRIGICYSIQNLNIDYAANMIEFVKKLDLSEKEKCLTFKFVHGRNGFLCSVPQLSKFYENILLKGNLIWNEMTNLQYLKKFMDKYSNKEDIEKGLPLNSYFQNNKVRCFTPYLFSLVDASGDVYPCCFLYYDNDTYKEYENKRQGHKIGKLSDGSSFEKIWLSDTYKKIRNELEIINVEKFAECAECTRHYLHNSFLTKIFNKYCSCVEEMGDRKGRTLFREILAHYSADVGWL